MSSGESDHTPGIKEEDKSNGFRDGNRPAWLDGRSIEMSLRARYCGVQGGSVNRVPIYFLKVVVLLIGLGALAFLLWEPHVEGRNAHATLFEIYFKDPFLAYAYAGSIPFFVALHQAFRVLGYAEQNKVFSQASAKALRAIKFCALAIVGFVVVGESIFILFNDSDDRAGGVAMGILIAFGSLVIAAAAAMFEGILRNAVDKIGVDSTA